MKIKKFLIVLSVFLITPVLLVSGCNKEKSSYNWVLNIIKKHYYEDLPEGYKFNGSVKDFVNEYLDKYSAFYTKEEYAKIVASDAGNKIGFGFSGSYVSEEDNHPEGKSGVLLEKIVYNSPADLAGLKAGEFVSGLTVNGVYYELNSYSEFSSLIGSVQEGENITFHTDKGDKEIAKDSYKASYCAMATCDTDYSITYNGSTPSVVSSEGGISYLPEGVAYLKLSQFYGNASSEMGLLMEQFNANSCTSLILDLRGNGGGYVDVMCDISAIYTGQLSNPLPFAMYAKYKNGSTQATSIGRNVSEERQFPLFAKLSVLADNGTASASEALLGVLLCNGIIDYSDVYISDFSQAYLKKSGTQAKNGRTYGKGIMQSAYVRPVYGDVLKLTTATIYWPDGDTCIHGTGLSKAMGCNLLSAEWNVTYNDEQLALAVQTIYG
ncbi:MAG: S41 family peptidase [Candidatus Coproplasma sp.]